MNPMAALDHNRVQSLADCARAHGVVGAGGGGYALADGSFGSGVTTDASGVLHGSDFLVDAVEFKLPVLGVPPVVA